MHDVLRLSAFMSALFGSYNVLNDWFGGGGFGTLDLQC